MNRRNLNTQLRDLQEEEEVETLDLQDQEGYPSMWSAHGFGFKNQLPTSSGLSRGFTRFQRPLKPRPSITAGQIICHLRKRNDIPDPFSAYAAAAMTSNSLSRTTGDALGEVTTSSSVSRYSRDVDREMKTFDEFRSIKTQTWKAIKICDFEER